MTDLSELEEISLPRTHRRKIRRTHPTLSSSQDYADLKQVFGIDNWIRMSIFSEYPGRLNTFDFVKLAVTDFYKSYPSLISLSEVNIINAIKQLKNLGTVNGIFSGYFDGDKPNTLCMYLEVEGKKVFALADNISYVNTKGYKGYGPDDLVSGTLPLGQLIFFFESDNLSVFPIVNSISKTNLEWEEESYIDMIIATEHGLALRSITLEPVEHFDLNLHYGEDFQSYNDKLLDRLDQKDKGIVMFHGPPGTGKTHYIRSLIPKLVKMDKRVILIPKHVISNLESPTFNTFMIENFADERIVFIIEDAESIVAKRESSGGFRSELVSTLLNITDGILNDIFNVQVILTFNTELSSIDDALLRKGRLISKYEFGNLDRKSAKKLAENIGVSILGSKESYSLADIYALKECDDDEILINQNIKKEKAAVGF